MDFKAKPLTQSEEAAVQAMIASDPDAPELTDDQARLRTTFDAAFPTLAAKMKAKRGRPKSENPKQHVSLRLDLDVLAKFKATGPGWQSRINDALRRADI